MAIDIRDYRHGGSSSPVYGSAPSFRRGEIGAPAATLLTPSLQASVKNRHAERGNSGFSTATCAGAARLIRAARLRDLLAAVEEWRRASGPDRTWWRSDALYRLREWRRLHQEPERAAFQQAVATSKRRRCADCGTNWADPPSKLCPGCEAYREHTGASA